jgi:allophanate hydrolase
MAETVAEILAAHARGRSPVQTVHEVYRAIAAWDDPALFITLRPEAEVAAEARALEAKGSAGHPLFGVPFVVKDNIDVAGMPTTAACPDFTCLPAESAFVVAKLIAAGALVIGKTNLDQFATGLVGVRSPYGAPRNSVRADLLPGGSSSGSATAVGAGIVPFSLGTDTAGSGRVPAAFNGIAGLKPSLGLLSARGMVPACRTLDTISIFARTVEDAVLVCQIAAGFDAADPYSRHLPPPALTGMLPGIRVGVPQSPEFFGDTAQEAAFAADIAALAARGAALVPVDLTPFFNAAKLLYEGPWVAERYAAVRTLVETRPEALLPVTRGIIESASRFSAADAFDARYRLAALRRQTEAVWQTVDALAVPTAPRMARIAEEAAEPLQLNRDLGTYTNFVNLLDLAAIAVPGQGRADGLPSSLTLIGPAGADGLLASIAAPRAGAAAPPSGTIGLAVVGAHLSGMALNHELLALGGKLVREAETAPHYRLFALAGTRPAKPGLLRVADGTGAAIKLEIWALDPAAFGNFVSRIPPPLGIGTLRLSDGDTVKGFLVEPEAVRGAEDISHTGGWRAYVG